jgi:predicted dehydrogenase
VLCEKPFADDAAQADEMFDVAGKHGKLVMEAFMYRCHPLTLAVEHAVAQGVIGEVRLIRTSFCYRTTRVEGNVRFDPELGGGILMDVGCYCINFARHFAQVEPSKVTASAHIHEKGVDDVVVGTLAFPNGVLASFTCGMSVQADNTAYICGSEGYVEIPVPWKPPVQGGIYTVARSMPPRQDMGRGAPPPPPREAISIDGGGDLYGNEADDFAASVLEGAPLRLDRADTVGNMRVLGELRRQIASQARA